MRECLVVLFRKPEMYTSFSEGTFFFIDMRSCYPLFPTNVWPMVVQIFLDNIRESADMLATPLKKA